MKEFSSRQGEQRERERVFHDAERDIVSDCNFSYLGAFCVGRDLGLWVLGVGI